MVWFRPLPVSYCTYICMPACLPTRLLLYRGLGSLLLMIANSMAEPNSSGLCLPSSPGPGPSSLNHHLMVGAVLPSVPGPGGCQGCPQGQGFSAARARATQLALLWPVARPEREWVGIVGSLECVARACWSNMDGEFAAGCVPGTPVFMHTLQTLEAQREATASCTSAGWRK